MFYALKGDNSQSRICFWIFFTLNTKFDVYNLAALSDVLSYLPNFFNFCQNILKQHATAECKTRTLLSSIEMVCDKL